MNTLTCMTWKDVLLSKGFDKSLVESFIGFISWDFGKMFNKMGKEINDVLNGYEGNIVAEDVMCLKYESKGILFFSQDIDEDTANRIFESILEYEHSQVYEMDYIP